MSESNQQKFKKLLAELFMLDQADLDFGIYRIMNAKRAEISQFLDKDLLPQVKTALSAARQVEQVQVEAELKKTEEAASLMGLNPDDMPKIRELRARYGKLTNLDTLENEVFSSLYDFFRRYYNDGDFLSLRRYKPGVYAIPYEGEEVVLHWANKDQYYVKTGEYFRDYAFKLPGGRTVHFKIAEADTEANNNKAETGKERRFILRDDPIAPVGSELVLAFEYRPDARKQADLNSAAVTAIAQALAKQADWLLELCQKRWRRADGAEADKTVLEHRLAEYTARNTFDYFIHKDLGGFLRRELDFYLKNEIMHLDDIENEGVQKIEQVITKLKAIRHIAHKIIDFLAQLEDFQKKLWLKKKFVVETNYCITLDRIPKELYPEIAKNDGQIDEWVKLGFIEKNEIPELKEWLKKTVKPGASNPRIQQDLFGNPDAKTSSQSSPFSLHLVLDTKWFSPEFKSGLLAAIDNLDEQTDGLLIHSENFQALNLLQERYREQIKCIYIDPPYNRDGDNFVYKDSYRHSSWVSFFMERVYSLKSLIHNEGTILVSIDDIELANASLTLENVFNKENHLATLCRRTKSGGGSAAHHFAVEHDYVVCYAKNKFHTAPIFIPHDKEYAKRYSEIDAIGRYFWDTMERSSTATTPYIITAPDGEKLSGKWFRSEKTFLDDLDKGEVRFLKKSNGGWSVQFKQRMASGRKIRSLLAENEFKSDQGELDELGTLGVSYPKPVYLIQWLLQGTLKASQISLDCFAGSGTTGHAVINLNREDGGKRKYILVEMGNYFNTVLKPRIQKVVYAKDWKDGKPVTRDTGISHCFKYVRLESYEDTLNNLELKRTVAQDELFAGDGGFREDYALRYMLEVEAKGSQSLLNLEQFKNPFAYTLKIATGGAGETKETPVDLVETFNYLLGLRIRQMDCVQGFRVITGTLADGEKVLVIWRNLAEKSNAELEKFFEKQKIKTKDLEFDLIYVNGDNNLENLRRPDESWKVRLIEQEFLRLMFDTQEL